VCETGSESEIERGEAPSSDSWEDRVAEGIRLRLKVVKADRMALFMLELEAVVLGCSGLLRRVWLRRTR